MSALRNIRRERAALALYAGKSDREAMEAAGYVYSPANGRRLRNSPDIKARLCELFAAETPFVMLDALRARREREALAYARMADYYDDVLDDDGKPTGELRFKGFARLTDAQIAAIAAFKQTKLGVEIKLYDKDAALRAIEARVEPLVDGLARPAPAAQKPEQEAAAPGDEWLAIVRPEFSAPASKPN